MSYQVQAEKGFIPPPQDIQPDMVGILGFDAPALSKVQNLAAEFRRVRKSLEDAQGIDDLQLPLPWKTW